MSAIRRRVVGARLTTAPPPIRLEIYQHAGETITGGHIYADNVTGGGSTGTGTGSTGTDTLPTVAITSTGGTVTSRAQTVAGTVDLADAGSTVNIYDGTTQIGTATADSNGGWTADVTLTNRGANVVTATDANAAGTGTSNSVTYTVAGRRHTWNASATSTI